MSEFGTTAAGRAWLRLAEPLSVRRPDPALPRARSLARNDRVRLDELGPGRVAATVEDRASRRVDVGFPEWGDAVRAAVGEILTRWEPDDDLVARLGGVGGSVAPTPEELTATCDCGKGGRCTHVLATLIEIARRVDEAPAVAGVLRGAAAEARPADPTRIPVVDIDPEGFWTARPV